MNLRGKSLLLMLLAVLWLGQSGCKERQPGNNLDLQLNAEKIDSGSLNEADFTGKEIFYGVYTPVEVSRMFQRIGVSYEPSALNPVENSAGYLSSSKAALNLGVYGVDLSYLKLFELRQEMVNYMLTVKKMAAQLGIPEDYIMDPVNQMERSISDSDSLMHLLNSSFERIEEHLEIADRKSTAGLMILGGWIESMYIATHLLYNEENPDPEAIARIAEQKYSLNSLLSFLKNYYDDPVVVYYTKKLKYLKRYYDEFEIFYEEGEIKIDTTHKVILAKDNTTTITLDLINSIKDYVARMRAETIS